jgi:hypothetical protein
MSSENFSSQNDPQYHGHVVLRYNARLISSGKPKWVILDTFWFTSVILWGNSVLRSTLDPFKSDLSPGILRCTTFFSADHDLCVALLSKSIPAVLPQHTLFALLCILAFKISSD